MKINTLVHRHPLFSVSDYEFLKKSGRNDTKIIKLWDSRLFTGERPLIHRFRLNCRAS